MYFPGVEAFLAIVQTENLTKAGNLLHLTQSTVSYRLKTLEQEMGVQLVERRKGIAKIRLTPTGENFVKLAERWSTLWRETQVLQTMGAQLSLVVSAANSLNMHVLPPLYNAINLQVPPIRLIIKTAHTRESLESIERRESDIAFLVREIQTPPSVMLEPFFEEDMVLIRLASPERATAEYVDLQSLQPEHELYMNWGTGYQAWHDSLWDPICQSRIRVDEAGLIPALMQNINQWSIVARSVANQIAQSDRFVVQCLSDPAPTRTCYKLTHKYPSQATLQVLRMLGKHIQTIYKKQEE